MFTRCYINSRARESTLAQVCAIWNYPKVLCVVVSYLGEVGALGAPHGGRAHPEDDGAGDERVELGVELGPDVSGVAEHGQHLGEFRRERKMSLVAR